MELTYNYRLISVANKAEVKERAKAFKSRFTDNDIFREMCNAFGFSEGLYGGEEIIRCRVEAFEENIFGGNQYSICMILMGALRMYRVHFYCNDDLEVWMNDVLLYGIETYKLVEEEN